MTASRAFTAGVEVNGETVLAVVDGMGAFKARALRILADNGIVDPAAGEWYAQQSWLDAFHDIAATLGPGTLLEIGRSIPDNARFPAGIVTVAGALEAIDHAYHMNHRGGEIGSYGFTQTGPESALVVCRNPYPCDFDRGVIVGTVDKFKPAHAAVRVRHDDAAPCRRQGADSCTYAIDWYPQR